MNSDDIFNLSVEIGTHIIKVGGEINRAEDTIKRINNSFGNKCEVFALPSVVIAQCNGRSQIRRIDTESTDLAELSRLNDLSRRICNHKLKEINITKKCIYSPFILLISNCIATASFSIFFGGRLYDALFSFIIAGIITYFNLQSLSVPLFTDNLICAFFSSIMAYIPLNLGIPVSPDKIIIGSIMLLVPGLTVVSSIRDMMNGDLIAGMIELFNSIISALGIALGVAGGIWIIKWI